MRIGHYCMLTALLWASRASAELISVYGSPTYTPGVGGFVTGIVTPRGINTAGTAVGSLGKGTFGEDTLWLGARAVRWDASGAIELGNLGIRDFTEASAINTAGTAVGFSRKYDGSGEYRGELAVRWDASGTAATELGHLGTDTYGVTHAGAAAINDAGTAVGFANKHDGSGIRKGWRAVRWDGSGTAATELDNLGTSSGTTTAAASAINSAGTAVGSAAKHDSSGAYLGTRAVRWGPSGTAATELGNLGTNSTGFGHAYAWAINTTGTALGNADKYDGSGTFKGERAVRWDGSGTAATELGVLGTDSGAVRSARAFAINTAATAVGFADKYDDSGRFLGHRAVRWEGSGTAATELGILGTDSSGYTTASAYAINDAGFAVGYANKYDAGGTPLWERAAYWGAENVAIDLNTLIDPASGWTLLKAGAISDTGWIAGSGLFDPDGAGGQEAYYRLFSMQVPATAVPETTSWAFLALAAVSRLRRRGRMNDRRP